MSGQKILQETGEELKQVSEVQWKKSLLSEVTPCKEEKQQMANWQSVLLCQNECVRRRRKVESDERKEIRSDLIWNHKSCQKMRRSLAELCGSEKLPPCKAGQRVCAPSVKRERSVCSQRWAECAQNPKIVALTGRGSSASERG